MYAGIVLEAYSPLGNPARPGHMKKDDDPSLLDDPMINKIASKHNSTSAQVILILYWYIVWVLDSRWNWPYDLQVCIAHALHRGIVVIPKTVTPSRITENLKGTQIKLDAEDMKRLKEVGSRNFRFLKVHSRNVLVLTPLQPYVHIFTLQMFASWEVGSENSKMLALLHRMLILLAGESILASWADWTDFLGCCWRWNIWNKLVGILEPNMRTLSFAYVPCSCSIRLRMCSARVSSCHA